MYRLACAINQFIPGLPEGCVTVEKLEELLETQLERRKGSFYYYRAIMDFAKKHPEKCILFTNADQHDLWPQNMSDAEKIIYENAIKSRLRNTADYINSRAGSIPGELKDIIAALNKPPVYNWRKHFRQVVGNSITSDIQLTRMRPSKRFPDAKGIRLKRKPEILVAVDTSGSISNNDLSEFFSEIHHIYKTGVNIDVVEFDTKIQKEFKYTSQPTIHIAGGGGTCAECVFDYYIARRNKYSSLIIFTDGYLASFDLPNAHNVVWVITANGNKRQQYNGQTILIP